MDSLTKWVKAYTITNKETKTVAEVLIRDFISRFRMRLNRTWIKFAISRVSFSVTYVKG